MIDVEENAVTQVSYLYAGEGAILPVEMVWNALIPKESMPLMPEEMGEESVNQVLIHYNILGTKKYLF